MHARRVLLKNRNGIFLVYVTHTMIQLLQQEEGLCAVPANTTKKSVTWSLSVF